MDKRVDFHTYSIKENNQICIIPILQKNTLYMKAHKLLNKTVTNMMKHLMTDELASKYSWTGQKDNKQKFENLELWRVIFGKFSDLFF